MNTLCASFLFSSLLASSDGGIFAVLLEYADAGGWMMYVIASVSLIGVTLFLLRLYDLYFAYRLNARSFTQQIVEFVEHQRFREALDACEVATRHPLVFIVKSGLLRANQRARDIERAMDKEMFASLPGLQKRVDLMAVLANVATLLGLLGTIFGLIKAFSSVAAASAMERQEALAAGISQAMYTTAFGIAVAVPLLVFHHILSKRVERIMIESEGGATSLLVAITGLAHQEAAKGQDGEINGTKP